MGSSRKYYKEHPEKRIEHNKNYRQSLKGKLAQKKADEKYKLSFKGRITQGKSRMKHWLEYYGDMPVAEILQKRIEWFDIREKILIRDNTECQVCGASNPRMVVHHVDRNANNNSEDNLITLCVKHHHAIKKV